MFLVPNTNLRDVGACIRKCPTICASHDAHSTFLAFSSEIFRDIVSRGQRALLLSVSLFRSFSLLSNKAPLDSISSSSRSVLSVHSPARHANTIKPRVTPLLPQKSESDPQGDASRIIKRCDRGVHVDCTGSHWRSLKLFSGFN